jgi:PAS domain S-box-containing protein
MRENVTKIFHKLMHDQIESTEYFENPIVASTGEEKIIAWHNIILQDEDGRIVGTLSSGEDVTERKQAEDALRESERRFRDLANLLPQSVFEMDVDGKFTYSNRYGFKTFGYTENDLKKGVNALELFIPEDRERIKENIGRRLTGKEFQDHEYTGLRKDGTKFPVLVYSNPIIRDKKPVGVRGIVLDITEQKRVEERLIRSRQQLRELASYSEFARERERSQIAREIHDELGQALTALKIDVHWLSNKLPKGHELLLNKTKSMSSLIDMTIKSVQRISSELRPGLLDNLGLSAAIEWQVDEFENRMGIICNIAIDPEEIVLDRDRSTAIFRILQESLTNIARHSNATIVDISLIEQFDSLELNVHDNGEGITEEQISDPRSFGLIGMRERVNLLGGYLSISGTPNKGTTIIVRIPLNKEE